MFDLSQVTSQKPQNIPDGKYICNATDATMKDTKSGGQMVAVTFTVAEGDFEGRKIFTNFNVVNSNPMAVQIGLGQMKSLLENSGFPTPDKLNSVTDICGLRVGVKTKTKTDDTYGDKTEVSYFFKPSEGSAPKAPTGTTKPASFGF